MLPVSSLLNPMEPQRAPSSPSRSISSSHSSSRQFVESLSQAPPAARPSTNNSNTALTMVGNSSRVSLRSRPKGNVNFAPFEDLEAASLQAVFEFGIFPFGRIMETARRIPYNSSKKDFYQKTGRESFDVIQYDFKRPRAEDRTTYTVMWDYNVGLVRMTPFFKCLEYSKTTPAKMLNLNPGLKDITYSITGGSIKAQGYWMPYGCAKAVCATFCYEIAGALIPLFGPDFPSLCVPDNTPGFRHMVIDQAIIAQAKREAARICQFPRPCSGLLPSPTPSRTLSPRPSQRSLRLAPEPYEYRRQEYERQMLLSPYGPDSDLDYRSPPPSELYGRKMFDSMPPMRRSVMGDGGGSGSRGPPPTSLARPQLQSPRGWTAVNNHQPHHTCRPTSHSTSFPDDHTHNQILESVSSRWLTALPRSQSPFAQGVRAPQPLPAFHRTPTLPAISSGIPAPILPPIRDYYQGRYGSLNNTNTTSSSTKRSFDQMDSDNSVSSSKRSFDRMEGDGTSRYSRSDHHHHHHAPAPAADHRHHNKHSRTPTPPSLSHPSPSCSVSSSSSSPSASTASSPSSSSFSASPSSSEKAKAKAKAKEGKKRLANEEDAAAMMLMQLKVGPKQEEVEGEEGHKEGEDREDGKRTAQQTGYGVPKIRTPLPGSRDGATRSMIGIASCGNGDTRNRDRDRDSRERTVKRLRRTLV
ncbi:hypothetical protein QBC44DRAFT_94151 [Cladorrhinum sp. PSN332]|nr:hypothetical protein QBC44DRAFT_94151 [Cladorrhinum sp. PSN332]